MGISEDLNSIIATVVFSGVVELIPARAQPPSALSGFKRGPAIPRRRSGGEAPHKLDLNQFSWIRHLVTVVTGMALDSRRRRVRWVLSGRLPPVSAACLRVPDQAH